MRGIYEVMQERAREGGREAYPFVIDLDVDPKAVAEQYGDRETAVAELLKGEIESWLESLKYVESYSVRRKF